MSFRCGPRIAGRGAIVGLALLVLSVAGSPAAVAQDHGAVVFGACADSNSMGQVVDCAFGIRHDDDYGDTFAIVDAYAIIDPAGRAEIVAVEMNELEGNAHSGAADSMARIGAAGSVSSGLPGHAQPGAVSFRPASYTVQPGDADPLSILGVVRLIDLCDAPGTVDCLSFPIQVQFLMSADIEMCPADLDGDGEAAFADVLEIIVSWGPCAAECPTDLSGNGEVDFADVLVVLTSWGPCG